MQNNPLKTIRDNYNRLSRWYDFISGPSEQHFRDAGISMLNLIPGEKLMEIGCGTGQSLYRLSNMIQPNGQVYGLDLSPGMLTTAKKKIKRINSSPVPVLINGSSLTLPFKDGGFDACFASFIIELLPDDFIKTTMDEINRTLKPNGRLCIVSMAASSHPTPISRLYEWAHQKFPQTIDCRPIHCAAYINPAQFKIQESITQTMWGLPVNISCFYKIVKP